ncbi:hypothetical protein [Microbacterium sp. LMI1-1-1.1]|uniref:hypothetical protein n=1 Tax=Microbacterium sp. LMI1-1-1.1 TaxID=3135223 RepID=UPI003467E3D7
MTDPTPDTAAPSERSSAAASERTAPAASERPRTAARIISIATTVLGAAVIAGTLGSTAVSAAAGMRGSDDTRVGVAGVTDLDVDVAGARLTVAFADVATAQLTVDGARGRSDDRGSGVRGRSDDRGGPSDRGRRGGSADAAREDDGDRGGWRMERDGDTLEVTSPEGTWFSAGPRSAATLTLPLDLAEGVLDAEFDIGAGSLDLAGEYRSLTVDVAGGRVDVDGTATSLDLTVTGGQAAVALADVAEARMELAGGRLSTAFTGEAPRRTDIELTAGSADVLLPDEAYRVTVDDGMGEVDDRLQAADGAAGAPRVNVSATFGSVVLRS